MQLASILLILVLLGCFTRSASSFLPIPSTQEFTPTSDVKTHSYSYTGGGNNVVRFELTFPTATDIGQVILWAGPAPSSDDKELQKYQHFFPKLSTNYDLEDVNLGKKQIVQIYKGPSSSSPMYIYVINLNRYDSLNYSISAIEQPGFSTTDCASGNPILTNTIYCSSCTNTNFVGAYCNIVNQNISGGTTYTLQLYGWGDSRGNFGTFTIPASNSKLYLYFKSSDLNIYNFIQFKTRDEDVAGLINYVENGGFNPLTKANTQYSIGITSGGSDISISFLNLNSHQVSLSIWYNIDQSSSILLIVLAILGGILFIGLVIVAICIVKKMNNPSQIVHPRRSISNNRDNNQQNNLTSEQVQKYFPSVLAKNVFVEEEVSSMNLNTNTNNNNNNNNSIDKDCVICLCPVGPNEMMKVLYCNHIFHAHCLTQWFKKNRNCPYCREEFNKKATIEHYQNLLKNTKKNHLMGVDLVSSIISNKLAKSSLLIQQIKD